MGSPRSRVEMAEEAWQTRIGAAAEARAPVGAPDLDLVGVLAHVAHVEMAGEDQAHAEAGEGLERQVGTDPPSASA